MFNSEAFSEEAKEFLDNYDMEIKVVEYFHNYFDNYCKTHQKIFNRVLKNYDLSKIETWIQSVSLEVYNWPELDYQNIVITLGISSNDEHVGSYELFCDLDGTVVKETFKI